MKKYGEKPDFNTGSYPYALLPFGGILSKPLAQVWIEYAPNDLILLAMTQHQLGKTKECQQTRQLLRLAMLRPEVAKEESLLNLIKELDAMVGKAK
ncbi:MAG: hypothetical protein QM703_18190 [Gemmatales bacterium]